MRPLVYMLALAGCGRLDFSDVTEVLLDARGTDDASTPDASPYPCGLQTPAGPVTLSGHTYRYTNVSNTHTSVASVVVTAYDAADNILGAVTSDGAGLYSLSIPAGAVRIDYINGGYWPSHLYLDQPLDRDVAGLDTTLWTLGDGPVWNAGAMGSVHSTAGVTRDTAKTTLNVAIRHCDGTAIENVVVTIDAANDRLAYTSSTGLVDAMTVLPHTNAVAFNVTPGTIHINAMAPGLTFPELVIDVLGGDNNQLTILHPYE